MRLPALALAAAALAACGVANDPGVPAPMPSPAIRSIAPGRPQITLADPTYVARAWQIASAVTRPGGVVVIGIDDIALRVGTHRPILGTRALAREAVAWGRSVLYLTTNSDPAAVRRDLAAAGFPAGPVWTPKTAPWCRPYRSDAQFRASCITVEARRVEVILWLTRGPQLPNPALRTYAFAR